MANDSLHGKNEKDQPGKPKASTDFILNLIHPCKELLYIGAIMCEMIDALFDNMEGLQKLDLKNGAIFIQIEARAAKTLIQLRKRWKKAEDKLMACQQE